MIHNWESMELDYGRIERLYDKKIERVLSTSYLFIYINRGEGMLSIDIDKFLFSKGDLLFIPADSTYQLQFKKTCSADYYLLPFQLYQTKAINRDTYTKVVLKNEKSILKSFVFQSADTIQPIMEDLFKLEQDESINNHFLKKAKRSMIFHYFVTNQQQKIPKDTMIAIEETKRYMEKHYADAISTALLAKRAGLSPKYYSQLFKKEYGIGVQDFLTEIRIRGAKELLIKTSNSLRVIAASVGYADEFYLSRVFKKIVGIPPTIYRKKREVKIASYDFSTTGHLLALQIIPYAAPLHPKWTNYYYQNFRDDILIHLNTYKIHSEWENNIQKLSAVKLDKIIAKDDISAEEKQELEKIAPVYYYSFKNSSWKNQLLEIATYINCETDAENFLKIYEDKVKETRKLLKESLQNEAVLVVSLFKNTIVLNRSRTAIELVYKDLGFTSAQPEEDIQLSEAITLSDLVSLNPTYLFVNIRQDMETIDAWDKLKCSIEWNCIAAVKNRKVAFIHSDPWNEYSASSHLRVLDNLRELMIEKEKVQAY
ncbi:AraC family transcription regulator [Niallia circulans]|jgi:AraC family transcriptional regulator, transcriptional activator for feuABC-ybbA operon|uniref:AraC family transcriptional regulator n=1 Tax=Niallia TaxID=2837506 RepID=UPI00077C6CED|nr:AraC family transcriptional regulator [Niallia circulans]MDR4315956.1 ABC transporter substrate-binding protein [Niallia circulans]MED3841230.1 AraC family transcriptional regulator [Niallia circulans]MED4244782.1 AraC family transcriptional regulator [Niallia circulans]MED4249735.1 AraC family transcriptional regulator [Niallia circulans]QKH60415.1 AraC family transcriptional regulator [Niallia circulans]